MGDSFDNTKLSTHITYLDANNLYGWAMNPFLHMDLSGWRKMS